MHLGDDGGIDLRQQHQGLVQGREDVDGALDGVRAQRGQIATGHEAPAIACQHHGTHTGISGDGLYGL